MTCINNNALYIIKKYPTIDRSMSDCQMGGRKAKGCSNNNTFLINGIIHEVMKSKKMKPILFQFYDYAQINLEYEYERHDLGHGVFFHQNLN